MLNELSCALLEIVILDVLEATNAVYDTELQWQMHCVLRSDALDLATAVLRSASMPHPELMCCLRCIILYYTMLYCILCTVNCIIYLTRSFSCWRPFRPA